MVSRGHMRAARARHKEIAMVRRTAVLVLSLAAALIATTVLAVTAALPAADAPGAPPTAEELAEAPAPPPGVLKRPDGWAWVEAPGKFVGLLGPNGFLWQFHFDPTQHLPYFDPVATVDGRSLTLNSPADHAWHHALWFAWKFINGLNYWETDKATGQSAGRTAWTGAQVATRPDRTARIEMALAYHPADAAGKPVLTEKRVMDVSAPDSAGVYWIDWTATFTAGEADVKLDRTPIPGEPDGKGYGGYAGLSVRFAADLADRAATSSDGPVTLEGTAYRGKHTAMDYSGVIGGEPAGIAILDHPKNLNAPTPWWLIIGKPMSYYSPAVLCYGPHTLAAGESLTLRYRVLVHPGRWDADRLKQEVARFAR